MKAYGRQKVTFVIEERNTSDRTKVTTVAMDKGSVRTNVLGNKAHTPYFN
jgi:hypothetical protein